MWPQNILEKEFTVYATCFLRTLDVQLNTKENRETPEYGVGSMLYGLRGTVIYIVIKECSAWE